MIRGSVTTVTLAVLPVVAASPALASCTLGRLAELPVTMSDMKPLVPVKINGTDAQMVVDSGAFFSSLSAASAAEYHLHLEPAPYNLHLVGIGGSTRASVATVSVFTLATIPLHNIEFVVGGSEVSAGAIGLLGQNILRVADTEYDLGNGAVRLFRPKDCGKSNLAYWAKDQAVSVMSIDWTTAGTPHTIGTAMLNGTRIRVMFDTGASTSMLAIRAAERAGFKPDAPGVQVAAPVRGIGFETVRDWIATFPTFELGEEQIRNARLRVADTRLFDVDMLLGADFFLSHRVYVATSQRRLYFTYNGGPVFNLSTAPLQAGGGPPAGQGASSGSPAAASSSGGTVPGSSAPEPTDAAGFSQRGAAFAARREFDRAIADLTRACELDPKEPRYLYERGLARLSNKQPFLAMEDFNQAIKLKPNDPAMLLSRAELRLAGRDRSGAVTDLEAIDRLAAKESDVRLPLAGLYLRAGLYAPAVSQFDQWIAYHAEDSRKPEALNGRCWTRAVWGQDLKKALGDCNTAVRLRPGTANFLDSRALVEQRLGRFDRAIDDYDAALRLQPKNPWMLYARGVAELHAGKAVDGKADIAAATALQPHIEGLARTRGVTP